MSEKVRFVDSHVDCPVCGEKLAQREVLTNDTGLAGKLGWEAKGYPYCKDGHALDWTGMAGPVPA